jgi:two-component system chemotaxis response regulator CheB
MLNRNIIAIGASAGGFDALKKLVAGLPENLDAVVFIVWHMSPEVHSVLPQVLTRAGKLLATAAIDGEPIQFNRIYVAPPDRHLVVEKGKIRVTRGPKENHFRPAVDPLFRSVALAYGAQVVGVVLSGALDDGTAGLWVIKRYGGVAIVQDPADAEFPSMPESALRSVAVDHIVPIDAMASLLVDITQQTVPKAPSQMPVNGDETVKREIDVAIEGNRPNKGRLTFGPFSPYTCPECGGVLSSIKEGGRERYRCHTGHAFSADSLLSSLTENIEYSLWNTIRAIEESMILLTAVGDNYAEAKNQKLADTYYKKAQEAEARINVLRGMVLHDEHLTEEQVENTANKKG